MNDEKKRIPPAFVAALVLLASGYASVDADTPAKCSSAVAPMTQSRVVTAQNDLGFKLLRASTAHKNVFISPLSIAQALGVVYLGARGETAKAFVKSSVVPPIDPADFACASQDLRAGLPQTGSDVALEFANALWVKQELPLKPSFIAQAHAVFGADATALDFASPQALRTINGWVNERTKGHIPTILNEIGGAEAIVTNAVYFKGLWDQAFTPAQTSDDRFNGAAGPAKVPFMSQTESFNYYAGSGFQLVRLGYRGERFAMYVVLPTQGSGLTMAGTLSSAFAEALAHAKPQRINLHIPKLHVEYSTDLVSPLTELGLGIAFSDRADFSAMSYRSLEISSVIHKTTLDVDEAGTTATAATAVVMEATARYEPGTPTVVKVDHPFFCVIRDDRTGAVLFVGAIADV